MLARKIVRGRREEIEEAKSFFSLTQAEKEEFPNRKDDGDRKGRSRSEHAPSEAHALSPACAEELAAASDARRVRRHRSGARRRCNVPGVVLLRAREDFVR